MKPPRISEKAIQAQCAKLLGSLGADVYVLGTRRPSGDYQGTRQTSGIPDLYAFLPTPPLSAMGTPVPLWMECKAKGGRLSEDQTRFRSSCQVVGQAHVVGDLDQLIVFLIAGGWLSVANVPYYRSRT